MTGSATYRQAILALLERTPRSEWVWTSTIGKMLAGPEWASLGAAGRCRWYDIVEFEATALVAEGLAERSAHLGWRRPRVSDT